MKSTRPLMMISIAVSAWMTVGFCATGAMALDYPKKPITIIVCYPPGGGQDVSSRILAKHANKYLKGSNFVVVNKTGGGGTIGKAEIARSKPDGYTVGTVTTGWVVSDLLIKGIPYTYKDFVPLAQIAADPHVFIIRKDLKMNLKQFVDYAKKAPKAGSIAIGCTWCTHDYFRVKLEKASGISLNRLPFQGGAPSAQAVAGGNADCSTPFVAEVLPLLDGNLVAPLAVSSEKRAPLLPDLPTFKELGYDVVQYNWRALTVPPGTPKEIMDYLEGIFQKTFNDPEFQQEFGKAGMLASWKGHQEMVKYVETERKNYSQILKELDIQPK